MIRKELADNSDRLLRRYDLHTREMEARINSVMTSCKIIKIKCQQDATKALVANHRRELKQKVEEALTRGWKEWSAQAAELQVFCADVENRKKEGEGFYKIQILCKTSLRSSMLGANTHHKHRTTPRRIQRRPNAAEIGFRSL